MSADGEASVGKGGFGSGLFAVEPEFVLCRGY